MDQLISKIENAFSNTIYPRDLFIRGSNLGDEPFEVEERFKGKKRWQDLSTKFINVPYPGDLSFLSDAAFRFYIPAYMISDLKGELTEVEPSFHLTHGLREPESSQVACSTQFTGGIRKTWFDLKKENFDEFNLEQTKVIVEYLLTIQSRKKTEYGEFFDPYFEGIQPAIDMYWSPRIEELETTS